MVSEVSCDERAEISLYNAIQELRRDYSDEIPVEVIHSNNPDNKYKVRKAWWMTVAIYLKLLEDFLPPELVKESYSLMDIYQKNLKQNRELTTEGDIKAANSLLDRVLSNLEKLCA